MRAYLISPVYLVFICRCLVIHAFSNSTWSNFTYITMAGVTCLKCPPGTYWVADCDVDYHIARCHMCPQNYYADTYNRADTCHPCSATCYVRRMIITSPCTGTANAICECPDGYFHNRRHRGNLEDCFPHTKCDIGYGVQVHGTKTRNSKCEPCRPGCTYSDVSSSVQRCKSCTACGPYDILMECGATHNTVCGIHMGGIMYPRNSTLEIKNSRSQDFPLMVILILIFSLVVFVLVLVVIKLYCWRKKYNILKGFNGPLDSSNVFSDQSSLQYAYTHDGMSSFYFSDASSITPSMRSRTTMSLGSLPPISELGDKSTNGSVRTSSMYRNSRRDRSRSTLNIQFPDEHNSWESRYNSVFSFLARKLSHHWKSVITRLFIGIGDKQAYSYTKQLDREIRSTREKMYEGLLEWKHRGGDSARPGKLLAALYILEFHSIIFSLRDKYPAVFEDDDDDDDDDEDDLETDV